MYRGGQQMPQNCAHHISNTLATRWQHISNILANVAELCTPH